jgi:group I intron endonuclease
MRCIYAIVNTITGNQYIGSSKNSYVRKKSHFNLLRRGAHHSFILQRAFDKYSEDKFKFIVLEKVDSNTDLIEREQWWLDNANCAYNLTKQALPGKERIITEETRAKMRAAKVGIKHPEWRKQKRIAAQSGDKHWSKKKGYSEEAKQRMSEAQKRLYANGYQHPGKKSVCQYDLNGKLINKWKSISEAARANNVCGSAITHCIHGKSKTAGGFKWSLPVH